MDFNADQKEALKIIKDKNVLVSAGAGSGKTHVLTNKIVTLLKNGYTLDDLLVVTFSNKAAFEMKDRVKSLLKNDPKLMDLVNKLETSDITTFDAFYLKIVKQFGYLLGIRSDISIVSSAVFEVKTNEFINKVLDKYYKNPTKEFSDLIYNYTFKNDEGIIDIIKLIIKEAGKEISRTKFYDEYESRFFNEKIIKKYIDQYYLDLKNNILEARKYYLDIDLPNYVDFLEEKFYLPLATNKLDDLVQSVLSIEKFPAKNTKGFKPSVEDNELYDLSKSIIVDKVYGPIKEIGDTNDILSLENRLKPYHKLLIDIAKEVDDMLYNYKNKFGAYDFKDIADLAYRLINIKEVNEKLRNRIKFIMIDEYQDTNPLQEEFISKIANNNLFMVGDMKQSIYGFRDADPTIFLDKFNRYQDNKEGKLIIFKNNYRSREEVLISVNNIFSKIMSSKCGGVDYQFGHELRYGNIESYSNLGKNNYNNAFEIKVYPNNEKLDSNEDEINRVIDDIIYKINTHYQVYDFEKKSLRDVTFKDFAILVEKRTHYDTYKQEFNKRQIPLLSDDAQDSKLFRTTIVIRSILKFVLAIKNNETGNKLIHPFVSLARSFLFNYSDAKIHNIVLKDKNISKTEIYQKAKEIIPYIDIYSNEKMLRLIISKFEIISKLPTIGDVLSNNINMEQMISFASDMDKLEYSFEEMSDFFEELDINKIELEVEANEDVKDAVKMLTIHKSKGLEYPICYFINLNGQKKGDSAPLGSNITNKFGVHLKDLLNNKESIFTYFAKKKEKEDSISERMRLFYVGLTRAKEKPIAFLSKKDFDSIESKKTPLEETNKMLNFIANADYLQYVKDVDVEEGIKLISDTKNVSKKVNIELRSVNIPSETIYPKKASKDLSLGVDKNKLRYGTKMHELLEIVDFKTKDTSFIKNKKEREHIDKIVNLDIFKNVNDALIYHEYEFDDEINNTVGIIDCLIIYKDHIDIIDFKLKSLDDEQYLSQLEIYENYVKDNLNSSLPINKYLLSIMDGEIKKL